MPKNHTYVLGINAYDHDVSACLLRDGEIAYGITKERLSREKHDTGFFDSVVDYCLEAEGISLEDVDLVVRNCYVLPVDEMEKRMIHEDLPEIMGGAREKVMSHPLYLPSSNKVVTISHHLAHAYSAFAVSPFQEGAVMVTDGVGSYCADVTEPYPESSKAHPLARESESYYKFSGSNLETVKKVWMGPSRGFLSDEFFNMEGLGAVYSRVSSYIFGDWNKCGEVMGLAPYGRPNRIKPMVKLENGELETVEWGREFNQPFQAEGRQAWEKSPSMSHWEDVAWQVQDDTERVLIQRAIWLRETTGAKHLTIAGGVGLNCVANGRILREAGFDEVWVQPAAGDDGIAIGCAYYGYLAILNKPRTFVQKHSCLGKEYKQGDVEGAISRPSIKVQINVKRSDDICAEFGKAPVGRTHLRMVPGWLRIRPARPWQPQHPGRSAQTGDEGYPEQPREVQAAVPPVCTHCAVRARRGNLRGQRRLAVHADREAGQARVAGPHTGPSCMLMAPRASRR